MIQPELLEVDTDCIRGSAYSCSDPLGSVPNPSLKNESTVACLQPGPLFVSLHSLSTHGGLMGALPCLSSQEALG